MPQTLTTSSLQTLKAYHACSLAPRSPQPFFFLFRIQEIDVHQLHPVAPLFFLPIQPPKMAKEVEKLRRWCRSSVPGSKPIDNPVSNGPPVRSEPIENSVFNDPPVVKVTVVPVLYGNLTREREQYPKRLPVCPG